MKANALRIIILLLTLQSCNNSQDTTNGHDISPEQQEDLEEPTFQYTSYSNQFELFAEADPFVAGETANILAHFTRLPGFGPLENGRVTAVIQVNGSETRQTLESPTRTGIYSFDVQPGTAGRGMLIFLIENENETSEIRVPEITVFADDRTAREEAAKITLPLTNTAVFTKEQSWKVDFATRLPEVKPFGQVIKTTALVKAAAGSESVVVAKTGGIVGISSGNIIEGEEVAAGETLFSISGSSLSENNLSVRYAEAKNNYERALANYERMKALAEDRIVSQRELLEAANEFENTKALYDNLRTNFTSEGHLVSSPINGYIRQVFVENGAYVEAGQAVITVSQSKTLMLTADVPPRYAPFLGNIVSANIHNKISGKTYTLDELNGKILSYGKAANTNNFLIPVNLEIDNKGDFIPGSFVEIYLNTRSGTSEIVVPNTSLLEEQENYFVWVQITPELFEKRLVVTGETDGINTQIKKNLTSDERIVSRGAMLIKLAQATGTLDAHSGHVH